MPPTSTPRAFLWQLLAVVFVLGSFAMPSIVLASPLPVTGWAWGGTDTDVNGAVGPVFLGSIGFSASSCGGYGGVSEDSTTGALSGYACADKDTLGWITFNSAEVSGCPFGTCAPSVNLSTSNITGWARACVVFASGCSGALNTNAGGWDGWISLSGVTQNLTTGAWSGYAWGSDAIGAIDMSGVSVAVLPPAAPTCSLSASPSSIASGGSSTLSWTTGNASSFSINQSIGSVSPVAGGSRSVSPTATVTYTGTATGTGGSVTCSATVTVTAARPTCSLSASPSSIASGGSSTLSWTTGNASSFSLNQGIGLVSPVAGGSRSVSPTATVTYTGTATGSGSPVTCATTVTLTAFPDLTAGAVSPTSATTGTAATFSATVSNTGVGSTGAGFTNLFQRATDGSGTGATDIGTFAMSTLSAGGIATASLSHTFASSGAYYLRVCADRNSSSGTGTISESNEGNNCGGWTRVNVALPAPPTAALSASPATIDQGQSSTLAWSSTNATSCTAVGGFSTGGATSGNVNVSPTATSNYQISCTGPGGSVNSNIVTVTVVSVTASISASPTCISGGGSSTISWSATPVSQVASCAVSGPGLSSSQVSGSQTVNVTSKSTYTISCTTTGGGAVTKSVIVDVSGCWSEF